MIHGADRMCLDAIDGDNDYLGLDRRECQLNLYIAAVFLETYQHADETYLMDPRANSLIAYLLLLQCGTTIGLCTQVGELQLCNHSESLRTTSKENQE